MCSIVGSNEENLNVLDLTEHQNLLRNFPKYFSVLAFSFVPSRSLPPHIIQIIKFYSGKRSSKQKKAERMKEIKLGLIFFSLLDAVAQEEQKKTFYFI